MDAGINGDFEYLINESSPASKPAFELVSNPSSLFFARISLSLFYFLFYSHPSFISSLFFFFFFSLQYHRANEYHPRWILLDRVRSRIFFGCASRLVRIDSERRLMKFYKGEGEFWPGLRERLREPHLAIISICQVNGLSRERYF